MFLLFQLGLLLPRGHSKNNICALIRLTPDARRCDLRTSQFLPVPITSHHRNDYRTDMNPSSFVAQLRVARDFNLISMNQHELPQLNENVSKNSWQREGTWMKEFLWYLGVTTDNVVCMSLISSSSSFNAMKNFFPDVGKSRWCVEHDARCLRRDKWSSKLSWRGFVT